LPARIADRANQIPLPHLRPAADVLLLGDLVELLAITALERVPGFAAALTTLRRLLSSGRVLADRFAIVRLRRAARWAFFKFCFAA